VRADGTSGDLEVLIVDETSASVRQRIRIPHAMDDDAVRLSGLSFDTAPYRLGPDRLAFGVRRDWMGSSQPNPFMETSLSLYEVRGRSVASVLENLVVMRSVGEWDLSCAGETEVTERILRMVPGKKGQDISVLERTTHSVSQPSMGGECETKDTPGPRRTIRLAFDGESYPVPRNISRE
ncbi:hypothetical protein LTR94_028050, partial [Friedmanniomyces endolithicus]